MSPSRVQTSPAPKAAPDGKTVPIQRKTLDDRPAAAWRRLVEGNQRWMDGDSAAAPTRTPERRAGLVAGQSPYAMVLGCADSRVPVELLFDAGLGELFVVRTAGHAVDEAVLGSVEYAVAVLKVDLVLVLGHESCGAISATARTLGQGSVPGGHIRGIVERLTCDMARGQATGLTDLNDLARWHSAATVELLQERSGLLRDAVNRGETGVLAAGYELASGRVREVTG